jgi:prepilin-type N-terminal cleavage/methylation domain-containing protein
MKPAQRSGFTLLEIMVALTAGGIALSSLYAIGSASTRHFREQQRISSAQTSLRSAMDMLKRDFQRAGYMSTPYSRYAGEACAEPAFAEDRWVGAINGLVKNAAKPATFDKDALNTNEFFSLDQVWLTGNFVTSSEYTVTTVTPDGQVTVPMGWQSFQRDFTEWNGVNAATCNLAAFQAAFPEGRMVRLHSMSGAYYYARVGQTNCTGDSTSSAQIVLKEQDIPAVCGLDSGWIAPVNTYWYHVVSPDAGTGEEDSRKQNVVLRRTEVDPAHRQVPLVGQVGANSVSIEDRTILDYVVRFNVDFLGILDGKVNFVPLTTTDFMNNPERVRGVVIDLAVRTSVADPDFTADVAKAAFKLNKGAGTGAARVRRMRAELLMPNMAFRNLR